MKKRHLKNNEPITLYPSDNQFFLKLVSIEPINLADEDKRKLRGYSGANIKYTKTLKDKSSSSSSVIDIFDFEDYSIINEENDFEYSQIEIEFINETEVDFSIEIGLETIDKIYSQNPYSDFYSHLSKNNNSKILFSAPFGTGKTTFLQDFFQELEKKYNVIHLFPVNYSVVSTPDIFELLKYDIFIQLLKRNDIEYEKISKSYLATVPKYLLNNIHNIFAPFIKLIPDIGRSLFDIYENLHSIIIGAIEDNNNHKIDDKEKIEKFIEKINQAKGSIYESDFYTGLITRLIKGIDNKKETVLIIDDLDRIDPEHIFRILNVLSAHFDSPSYKNLESTNKFGFDKIILVCDNNNLQNIFAHKFGYKTDFNGYIDKFYSSDIYYYKNIDAIQYKLATIEKDTTSLFFKIILRDFRKLKLLSIREAIRLKNIDLIKIRDVKRDNTLISNIEQYIILSALNTVFTIDSLIAKFQVCKEKMNELEDRNYRKVTRDCFIPMAQTPISHLNNPNKRSLYIYDKQRYSFKSDLNKNNFFEVIEVSISGQKKEKDKLDTIEFNSIDFYTIVLMIIEKYKKHFN